LRQLNKGIGLYSAATTRFPQVPINLQWAVGDTVWNSAPAVAAAKGWICTTAGEGTGGSGTAVFTTMGNL